MSALTKFGETSSSGTSIRCWLKIVDTPRSDPSYTSVDCAVSPMWLSASRPGRSRIRFHQANEPSTPRHRMTVPAAIARFFGRKWGSIKNWGSITTSTPERQINTSKHQHQRHRGATVVQFRIAQHEGRDCLVLKRMEVANITTNAKVLPSDDDAAADVPAEVVVIGRQQAGGRKVDVRLHQAKAEERKGADRPDIRDEHHIAHHGQHARVQVRRRAEKVAGVRKLLFEAKNAAHFSKSDAVVQTLVLAPRDVGAVRVTAEIEPDQRADVTLGVSGGRPARGQRERKHAGNQPSAKVVGHRCSRGGSRIGRLQTSLAFERSRMLAIS